jgi:hypothetical protein
MGRIILLNSLVVPKGKSAIFTAPISKGELKNLVNDKELVSFVGHPSTAQVLSEILNREIPVSRAEYVPQSEDAIVVRLKQRQANPGHEKVSIEDLEFYHVAYQLF